MEVRAIRVLLSACVALVLSVLSYPATAQTWTFTGNLNVARGGPGMAVLTDGRVLAQGGGNASGAINSAEIYDPSTATWTLTSNTLEGHTGEGTIRLANGRVLVCGGFTQPNPTITNLCEIYDPVAGTWSRTGSMNYTRAQHGVVLLPSGLVLVMGGDIAAGCYCPQTSAELYNPSTGTWTVTGSMAVARTFPEATLLGNGKVLVAGGTVPGGGSATATAELYDPAAGTWTFTGSLNQARFFFPALLLGNGKVLVSGGGGADGGCSSEPSSAELYDPASGTWSYTGSMSTSRIGHGMVLLGNGQVLVSGGTTANCSTTVATTETYDPSSGTWSSGPNMNQARTGHGTVLLLDGRVLVAAGNFGSSYLSSAEILSTAQATLVMGPQAMEGDLKLSPGTTLQVGYDFTMPGTHPTATVSFIGAQVTFAWTCVAGPGSGTLVVPMAEQSYTDAQNSPDWYPSGDQNSSLVYQGSITVPNYCNGGAVRFQAGGTFSTGISSTDTQDKVNVRWHYSGNGRAGSWSGTQSVVP